MSVLFCDSNSEIWYETQEKLGIEYIAMPYAVEGQEFYYDLGKATDFQAFYNQMREGCRVITSALNAQDYLSYFEPILADGKDILYVSFSHKMSATFLQMDEAIKELKEKYPERTVRVFDTKLISIGAGLLVYAAANWHNDGMNDDDIIERLTALRRRVALYFTPETLSYLARGGRLTKGKAIMGNLFNVKPILTCKDDGTLDVVSKVNGRKKAIREFISKMADLGVDRTYPIIVTDAEGGEDTLLLCDLIKELFGEIAIWRQQVGPVVGCHCGPGTIGITWIADKDLY